MVRRWLLRCSMLLAAGMVAWVVFLLVAVPVWNHVERTRSAAINAPPILINSVGAMTFPDALHIGLPDGRVFRLAHVVAPDPGTPEYARAATRAAEVLWYGFNEARGLKPVGTSAEGETLVELWGFQRSIGGCGNSTWSERRRAQIPHWKCLTWQLVAGGDLALEHGSADSDAIAYEAAARHEGQGLWARPEYVRRFADLARYEAIVFGDAKPRHTIYQHREALALLLRADPETYAPRAVRIVRDRANDDVHFRAFLAIALEDAERYEGTDYLMDALRGRVDAGLDESAMNSVVNDYIAHWNAVGLVGFGDEQAMVRFYKTRILPKRR